MENLLEYLPAFVLFGSMWAFMVAWVIFIVVLFWAEISETSLGGLAWTTVFFVILFFWSDFDIFIILTWQNILIYLGIGLLYSGLRTYIFGQKESLNFKEKRTYTPEKETVDEKKKRRADFIEGRKNRLKEKVFVWWFLWPFSLLNWIFSDLIRDLWRMIYKKVKVIYDRLFDLGFGN